MTYGPNLKGSFLLLTDYVDKILKGANLGKLPVQEPTRFELMINLKAAREIGLDVPLTALARRR